MGFSRVAVAFATIPVLAGCGMDLDPVTVMPPLGPDVTMLAISDGSPPDAGDPLTVMLAQPEMGPYGPVLKVVATAPGGCADDVFTAWFSGAVARSMPPQLTIVLHRVAEDAQACDPQESRALVLQLGSLPADVGPFIGHVTNSEGEGVDFSWPPKS